MNNELKYLIALSHFYKYGPKSLELLLGAFLKYEKVYFAEVSDITRAGINSVVAHEFVLFRNELDVDGTISLYEKEGIKFATLSDEEYPRLLKEIHDPPPILFYRGCLDCLNENSVSVVGSRKFSSYGRRICNDIVFNLAKSGITIVSGLALGIDALAHFACLNASGKTVGVLGSGVNEADVYPVTNKNLAKRIIESGGAVVSEFPYGTPALKQHFPRRNRIIAGLTRGTLVVEANLRSGTLITANLALDFGRDVLAVPGNIYDSTSAATIKLLKQGATIVTEAEDVLNQLGIDDTITKEKFKPENEQEEVILKILSGSPIHMNEVVRLSKLDIAVASSTLMMLEIKGVIAQTNGCYHVLNCDIL